MKNQVIVTRDDRIRPERQIFNNNSSNKEENIHPQTVPKNVHGKSVKKPEDSPSKDFEIKFFQVDSGRVTGSPKALKSESTPAFQNEAFNAFVTEFDTNKLGPGINNKKSGKEEELEAEVERLKERLKQANVDKAEMTSNYEKLSAICRSQKQGIQQLKQTLAARTLSPNREASKDQTSLGIQPFVSMLASSSCPTQNCLH